MHIPDGYLSPSTCLVLTAATVPVWMKAKHKLQLALEPAKIPLVAMGAVVSFLVMMLNIPIPDGTTAHAVGASLLTIVVGPWAAVIAVSMALLIQALLFGDGGMLAFGANAFNMAVVMPLVTQGVFSQARRLVSPVVAAGIAGYIALNMAALVAAVEFGLQPLLFRDAAGLPLYCPYGWEVAVPAMAMAHLTIAGFAEAAVTALGYRYIASVSPEILQPAALQTGQEVRGWKKHGLALLVLAAITPAGLLAEGTAWGEWGADEILKQLGYVPQGMAAATEWWQALLPEYTIPFLGDDRSAAMGGYFLSAVLGGAIVYGITMMMKKMLVKAQG